MSFSDEDCENLIELIRQHPPLYNAQLDSYRDEHLKDNIWKSIAESINKTDSECRKKWKLIRDSYNRYKRKQKQSTGSAAPAKNSKWQFYERLRFLENTPSERQSCTSVEQEQQSSASVEKEVTNTSPGVEHEDTPHEAADTSVHNSTLNTPSNELPGTSKSTQERSNIPLSNISEKSTAKNTKRKRQKEDEFIKFMKDRQENRNRQLELLKSQDPVDDISTFTKHIEMMLRKLSPHSRAMAKTEIFNIVSKYEIGDIEGQTERPYTSSYISNSSYNSYSPISAASSEHQTQTGLTNISSEPFLINYGEIDQNNINELANLP
ncbi:transcription factor Adf-1-like [Nilaparvata lugens]|uniref:transcription factor Adf-1-like n=1 Tax=Nilaparvata lugens TaxID=108931 RepID=UPI00193D2725|nr:transcription factor Adf-1-like [Nilaparvata lugens]